MNLSLRLVEKRDDWRTIGILGEKWHVTLQAAVGFEEHLTIAIVNCNFCQIYWREKRSWQKLWLPRPIYNNISINHNYLDLFNWTGLQPFTSSSSSIFWNFFFTWPPANLEVERIVLDDLQCFSDEIGVQILLGKTWLFLNYKL